MTLVYVCKSSVVELVSQENPLSIMFGYLSALRLRLISNDPQWLETCFLGVALFPLTCYRKSSYFPILMSFQDVGRPGAPRRPPQRSQLTTTQTSAPAPHQPLSGDPYAQLSDGILQYQVRIGTILFGYPVASSLTLRRCSEMLAFWRKLLAISALLRMDLNSKPSKFVVLDCYSNLLFMHSLIQLFFFIFSIQI